MNKKLTAISVCIALPLPGMAQRKAKINAAATWADGIAVAKNQADAEIGLENRSSVGMVILQGITGADLLIIDEGRAPVLFFD